MLILFYRSFNNQLPSPAWFVIHSIEQNKKNKIFLQISAVIGFADCGQ